MAKAWLVLLAAMLAGCAAGPTVDELAHGYDQAVLRGVVVDEAVRPIADAVVTIPAIPGATATTSANGTFEIADLAPGTVIVQVAKGGYLTATAQLQAETASDSFAKVVLVAATETIPYIVQETYEGFLSCGVGSGPAFGLSAGCEALAGSFLDVACRGQDPIPPAGVCVGGTEAYYAVQALGNMSMVQTELTWTPTSGSSELLLVQWAVDGNGQLIKGIGMAMGPPYLVSRLDSTVLRDSKIGGENTLSVYVSVGSGPPANVVVQQPYRVFHTTAYSFEFEADWVFIEDGAPIVPPACTTCLD